MDEDWEEYDPSSGLTFVDHMLAGSMAGVMEHVAMFPVDTVKTHMQVDSALSVSGRASTRKLLQTLTVERGMWRLWRGVHSLAIGCVPAHAAYFSVYELAKSKFGANEPGHHPMAAAGAGILSVAVHDSVMTPADMIKQRLQLGYYRGMWDCIKSVARTEGLRGFFVSYPTTLAMNIPHHAVMVAANESFKLLFTSRGLNDPPVWALVVSGGAAGALACAVSNPLDVIKTRLQTQGALASSPFSGSSEMASASSTLHPAANNSAARHQNSFNSGRFNVPFQSFRLVPYAAFAPITTTSSPAGAAAAQNQYHRFGFVDAAQQIYLKEGWRGFTRGLVPRLLVNAPSSAICWTTYELLKQSLLHYHQRRSPDLD